MSNPHTIREMSLDIYSTQRTNLDITDMCEELEIHYNDIVAIAVRWRVIHLTLSDGRNLEYSLHDCDWELDKYPQSMALYDCDWNEVARAENGRTFTPNPFTHGAEDGQAPTPPTPTLEEKIATLEERLARSVTWAVDDFESVAQEREGGGELLYDRTQFPHALHTMMRKHDASLGISWLTVEFWLDELCLLTSV
tara:strand:+ start:2558 stop:3142 length:585 start_codon:yes stop_codon:yes gene_type:complete